MDSRHQSGPLVGEKRRLPQRTLTVDEVADRLAVSRRTVLDWIGIGRLSALRLSPRTIRVRVEDLTEFIARSSTDGEK